MPEQFPARHGSRRRKGGAPGPMSDFIADGEWGPAFSAQNRMHDEHAKKYNLQEMDWRKQKPWYKPTK